jgi:hypothetical protein
VTHPTVISQALAGQALGGRAGAPAGKQQRHQLQATDSNPFVAGSSQPRTLKCGFCVEDAGFTESRPPPACVILGSGLADAGRLTVQPLVPRLETVSTTSPTSTTSSRRVCQMRGEVWELIAGVQQSQSGAVPVRLHMDWDSDHQILRLPYPEP